MILVMLHAGRSISGGWPGIFPGASIGVNVLSVDVLRQRISLGVALPSADFRVRERVNDVEEPQNKRARGNGLL